MIKVNQKIKLLNKKISKFTGLKKFILYGGTALDLLLNKKPNDFDVGVIYNNKKDIKKVKKNLEKNGFEIIVPWREYFIHKNEKTILVYAKKRNYYLDIAFVKRYDSIGLFNLDSIFINYPKNEVIDHYQAFSSIKKKIICLIRNINQENPFVLLGRMIYLCEKYCIRLSKSSQIEILTSLKKRCEIDSRTDNNFENQIIPSFYSQILKTILVSKEKRKLIKILVKYKIFEKIFFTLHYALKEIIENNRYSFLDGLKKKGDVILFFREQLNPRIKKLFDCEIGKMGLRNWDKIEEKKNQEIILIRHGSINHLDKKKRLGRIGKSEAKKTGKFIKEKYGNDLELYSSSQKRAVQTAKIVGKELGIKSKTIQVNEIDFSYFNQSNPKKTDLVNVKKILKLVRSSLNQKRVIVLCLHAGLNLAIIGKILGINRKVVKRLRCETGSISILENYPQGWQLSLLNFKPSILVDLE